MKNIENKIVDESNLIRNEFSEEFEIPDIDTLIISAAIVKMKRLFVL